MLVAMSADPRQPEYPLAAGRHAARIIVLGNEKGGSGKSTTAMHLVVHLLREGWRVGCLDLDARQGTMTRYVRNRIAWSKSKSLELPIPNCVSLNPADLDSRQGAEAREASMLDASIADLGARSDFVVVDTPGSDSFLARRALAHADTLITPLNDSFVDLDILAEVDPETYRVIRPSHYAVTVWEQRKARAAVGGRPIDWIVIRNRLGTLDSQNNKAVSAALGELSRRIGFRMAPGFTERVIFRELFPKGLTLLDLREEGTGVKLSMSHLAARQEIGQLVRSVGLGGAADGQARLPAQR